MSIDISVYTIYIQIPVIHLYFFFTSEISNKNKFIAEMRRLSYGLISKMYIDL